MGTDCQFIGTGEEKHVSPVEGESGDNAVQSQEVVLQYPGYKEESERFLAYYGLHVQNSTEDGDMPLEDGQTSLDAGKIRKARNPMFTAYNEKPRPKTEAELSQDAKTLQAWDATQKLLSVTGYSRNTKLISQATLYRPNEGFTFIDEEGNLDEFKNSGQSRIGASIHKDGTVEQTWEAGYRPRDGSDNGFC